MTAPFRVALLFIAICAVSTGAMAIKVYKCGATYSQIPCPEAEELQTTVGPSAAQQRAAQKENRLIEKAANQMEKERQAEERALAKELQDAEDARKAAATTEKKKAKGATAAKKKTDKGTLYFTAAAPAGKASQPK